MNTELCTYELTQEEINMILDFRDSSDETQGAVVDLLHHSAERNRKKKGYPFAGMSNDIDRRKKR